MRAHWRDTVAAWGGVERIAYLLETSRMVAERSERRNGPEDGGKVDLRPSAAKLRLYPWYFRAAD